MPESLNGASYLSDKINLQVERAFRRHVNRNVSRGPTQSAIILVNAMDFNNFCHSHTFLSFRRSPRHATANRMSLIQSLRPKQTHMGCTNSRNKTQIDFLSVYLQQMVYRDDIKLMQGDR